MNGVKFFLCLPLLVVCVPLIAAGLIGEKLEDIIEFIWEY